MARDDSGPKNQPIYSATGASADAADLTELGQYAADVGNRKSGTTTQRNALANKDVWEGLEFEDTTLKRTFVRVGGSWEPRAWALPYIELLVTASNSAATNAWTSKTGFTIAGSLVRSRGNWTVNNGVIGVPEAGLYAMSGYGTIEGNASGVTRGICLQLDGNRQRAVDVVRQPGGFNTQDVIKSTSLAGVYVASTVELQIFHDATAALGFKAGYLTIMQLGAV